MSDEVLKWSLSKVSASGLFHNDRILVLQDTKVGYTKSTNTPSILACKEYFDLRTTPFEAIQQKQKLLINWKNGNEYAKWQFILPNQSVVNKIIFNLNEARQQKQVKVLPAQIQIKSSQVHQPLHQPLHQSRFDQHPQQSTDYKHLIATYASVNNYTIPHQIPQLTPLEYTKVLNFTASSIHSTPKPNWNIVWSQALMSDEPYTLQIMTQFTNEAQRIVKQIAQQSLYLKRNRKHTPYIIGSYYNSRILITPYSMEKAMYQFTKCQKLLSRKQGQLPIACVVNYYGKAYLCMGQTNYSNNELDNGGADEKVSLTEYAVSHRDVPRLTSNLIAQLYSQAHCVSLKMLLLNQAIAQILIRDIYLEVSKIEAEMNRSEERSDLKVEYYSVGVKKKLQLFFIKESTFYREELEAYGIVLNSHFVRHQYIINALEDEIGLQIRIVDGGVQIKWSTVVVQYNKEYLGNTLQEIYTLIQEHNVSNFNRLLKLFGDWKGIPLRQWKQRNIFYAYMSSFISLRSQIQYQMPNPNILSTQDDYRQQVYKSLTMASNASAVISLSAIKWYLSQNNVSKAIQLTTTLFLKQSQQCLLQQDQMIELTTPHLLLFLQTISQYYSNLKQHSSAEPYLRTVLSLAKRLYGADSVQIVDRFNAMGNIFMKMGRHCDALHSFKSIAKILQDNTPLPVLTQLSALYLHLGDIRHMREICRQIIARKKQKEDKLLVQDALYKAYELMQRACQIDFRENVVQEMGDVFNFSGRYRKEVFKWVVKEELERVGEVGVRKLRRIMYMLEKYQDKVGDADTSMEGSIGELKEMLKMGLENIDMTMEEMNQIYSKRKTVKGIKSAIQGKNIFIKNLCQWVGYDYVFGIIKMILK